MLHGGGILLDSLENCRRANNRRIQEIFLSIRDIKMELESQTSAIERPIPSSQAWEAYRRSCMDHSFQPVDLYRFVKGTLLRNILDDAEIQLGRGGVGVRISDLLSLCLGTNGGDDTVATFEKDIEDVRCNEAAATCIVVRP